MRSLLADRTKLAKQDRFASTLVIAASIIAAVRLARDDISRPSPRLYSVIGDSVRFIGNRMSVAYRTNRKQKISVCSWHTKIALDRRQPTAAIT